METWVSTYAEGMKPKDAWLECGARHREEWAGKAEPRSNQAYEKSIKIGDRMEIGQPILVGHHSEKRHWRDIQTIRNATSRASEEATLAKGHAGKATTLRAMAKQRDNPAFCTRRMEEAKVLIRKLEREGRTDSRYYTEAQDKLAYWQAIRDEVCPDFKSQVADAKAKRIFEISASKWVFSYIYGWTELVKVNRATVEVKSNFPSQPNFRYPIKFVDRWHSKMKSSNHD
jgi:hypothetical protein